MRTFSQNMQEALRHAPNQCTNTHATGLWLLMLKDNVTDESPEFGMMSIMQGPGLDTFIGTFDYEDQQEEFSYQIEWSFQEPDAMQVVDHYSAWNDSKQQHHDIVMGHQPENPEVMGISLERPGESPLIFVGVRLMNDVPEIN